MSSTEKEKKNQLRRPPALLQSREDISYALELIAVIEDSSLGGSKSFLVAHRRHFGRSRREAQRFPLKFLSSAVLPSAQTTELEDTAL